MKIIEFTNAKIWDKFIAVQNQSQFLESWAWGEIQKKEGRKIYRLAVIDNDPSLRQAQSKLGSGQAYGDNTQKISAVLLLIKYPLIFKWNYFYTPRGPIFRQTNHNLELWNKILEKVKELAKNNNVIFWRFEPILPLPKNLGLDTKSVAPIQPKNTLILDLKNSEEEILAKMHPKTRYNIRLAQKRGVKIKIISEINENDFKIFWNLLRETAKRDKFNLHPFEHYRNLTNSFSLKPKLFFAVWHEKIIATNLVVNFGDTSTYLHGASANEFRNLMASHLLQWEAIKEAKQVGCHYYDFWGVNKLQATSYPDRRAYGAGKLQANHNYRPDWEGITRFKRGFGGQEVNFPGTFEIPIKKDIYWLYSFYKNLKISIDFLR